MVPPSSRPNNAKSWCGCETDQPSGALAPLQTASRPPFRVGTATTAARIRLSASARPHLTCRVALLQARLA
jgi:hypothetical protein